MVDSNDSPRPALVGAAEQVAVKIHGSLGACSGLLIAGSEMGDIIAECLLDAGLGHLVVTARVPARAEIVARRFGCHFEPFEILHGLLGDADIVISAVGSGSHLIGREMVAGALSLRRQKPIFLIDAAVPGDVQPAVDGLDGAFLYDIGDLERVAMEDAARMGHRPAAAAPENMASRLEAARRAVLAENPQADSGTATRSLIDRFLAGLGASPRDGAEDEEQDR